MRYARRLQAPGGRLRWRALRRAGPRPKGGPRCAPARGPRSPGATNSPRELPGRLLLHPSLPRPLESGGRGLGQAPVRRCLARMLAQADCIPRETAVLRWAGHRRPRSCTRAAAMPSRRVGKRAAPGSLRCRLGIEGNCLPVSEVTPRLLFACLCTHARLIASYSASH